MKIFLDDVRQPQQCVSYMHQRIGKLNPIYLEDWKIVRNFDEFQQAVVVHQNEITHISFDHDLADIFYDPTTGKESFRFGEKTGEDCAIWLRDLYKKQDKQLPILFVHSMNPTGTQNIINVFK